MPLVAATFASLVLAAGAADAGQTWRLSSKLPKGGAERKALVAQWSAPPANPSEVALTAEEAEALLDDPRAELVYGEKTISIVAPSMKQRHRQEHVDLLKLFLQPARLKPAVRFAQEHHEVLERARVRHRVDPSVVVSIIAWESNLGTITGDYFAFNSFTSQTFFIDEANEAALAKADEQKQLDAKAQAGRVQTIRERARRNLAVLVRTCKARGIDPLSVKGSWAGALGYPQFMPASLRWAEDGDGDGKIDLYTFDDSIASVANYLQANGYEKSRRDAVWDYNHEEAYVTGVLAFADALTAKLREEAADGGAPDGGADAGPSDSGR
ncbi:MAG: lytic murein transglycosylase [Myxococcaceae bacterium]